VFSPVHYALVLYSVLIEVGRLGPDALDQFNRDGSTVELIGAEHSPGHEVTAGSLGQAISQAGGIALARRLRGDAGRVWVFMSDGEFQEGQTWEAFAALSYYQLDNLGVYVDANGQQCDGSMDSVMNIEPLADRLTAFGADVHEVNGHDLDALATPAASAPAGKPLVVVARTDPCRDMEILRERTPKLHYLRFKSEEETRAYEQVLRDMDREAAGRE
jgi:transketolase